MRKPSTEEQFFQADHLLDKGRFKEAYRLFLVAAKAGDTGAQLNVGFLFDTGKGVRRSSTQAMYWYRRAFRRGEVAAANNIATLYRDEGRLRLAVRWFEKATALGDDNAMLQLAKLYLGPLKDVAKARRLLSKVSSSKNVTLASQEQAEQLLSELSRRRASEQPRRKVRKRGA